MSDTWNPQEPAGKDPERNENAPESNTSQYIPTYTPPQHQPPQDNPWAAPSGEGATWARQQQTTQQPTTEHSAYTPPASGWGEGPPPTDFSFATGPTNNASGKNSNAAVKVAGVIVVLLLMIGSGAIGGLIASRNDSNTSSPTTRTVPTIASAAADPASQPLAKVAAAAQPSVVSIEVSVRGTAVDTGSGFIYSSNGTIVTNNHVISAAVTTANSSIRVKFADGQTATATVKGRDPSTDIAVITVPNTGLTQAALGSSSSLHVGDTVLALGSPLGLEGSVASGIVSALHRSVNLGSEDQEQQNPFGNQSQSQNSVQSAVTDAIQTDAAINPGNSGGPLVDINGKVVGINTAIASLGSTGGSSQSGSIGVGFAIPIEEVQSVADQLIQGKTPQHAILGVQISDDPAGALVQAVTAAGSADKAGLKEGDIITKFGDKKITSADELSAAVRTKNPSDKVTITYDRGGATKTTDVTLGSSND